MTYNVHETQVLIVGGGLTGLSAALFLRHHGVDSVLIERHRGTSPQPKARRINLRTMETYRQIGIDDTVSEAAAALAGFQGMSAGPTLAQSRPLPWNFPGGMPDWDAISPSLSCLCAQDLLEPVLRELAAGRGCDLRFGAEVTDVAADEGGVTATVRAAGGQLSRIRAAYLIAADGARSPVRERLGIGRGGRGTLGRFVNVYFRADLAGLIKGREFNLCQIENPGPPGAPGAIASINGTDRWIFSTAVQPERTAAQWAEVVRAVIGATDAGAAAEVEILSVLEWEPGMFVADRFAADRIFLAGDAAHVMPPYAALGANTGIQDVHNLAWKLAMVLDGRAGPGLLHSYAAERPPAAWFAADQSSVRTGNLREINSVSRDGTPLANPMALTLGFQYPGGAVVGDGSTAAIDRLDLRGQPGTRLPHRWLDGKRWSTLDLAGSGLTLVAGPGGEPWAEEAARLRLCVRRAGPELADWAGQAGIGTGGALLLRPDHIVAWRAAGPPGGPGELEKVTGVLLDR